MKKWTFFLLLILFAYLEYVYAILISDKYGYLGFSFQFDFFKYIEGKVLLFLGLGTLFYKKNTNFMFASILLFLVYLFIPNLILYQFMDVSRLIPYSILLLTTFMCFFGQTVVPIKIPKLTQRQQMVAICGLVFVLLIPFVLSFGLNLNLMPLLFQAVYDVRAENAASANIFVGYFYSMLGVVLFPVLLVRSLEARRYMLAGLTILGFIYLYLTLANKITFLSLFSVIVFYFFKSYKLKVNIFLASILSLFAVGRLAEIMKLMSHNIIEDILIRRVFFLPALLNHYYYEYFKTEPLLMYSDSVFRRFVDYPYEVKPPYLIAQYYFNAPKMNATNGIISDGYINFGVLGVVFSVAVVAFIFAYLNSLNISARYFGILIILVTILVGSNLFTSILTHGIFYFIVMSHLLLKNTGKHDDP